MVIPENIWLPSGAKSVTSLETGWMVCQLLREHRWKSGLSSDGILMGVYNPMFLGACSLHLRHCAGDIRLGWAVESKICICR